MTGSGDDRHIDLTEEDNDTIVQNIKTGNIPPDLDLELTDSSKPKVFKLDKGLEEMRETARADIAKLLFVLLFLIVIWCLGIFTYDPTSRADLKDVMSLLFTPIIGVLGTVLGFYFGAQTAKN